jgi:hypothetical protein
MTPPRASDNAPSLLVVSNEHARRAIVIDTAPYSVPIRVAGAKAIARRAA